MVFDNSKVSKGVYFPHHLPESKIHGFDICNREKQ